MTKQLNNKQSRYVPLPPEDFPPVGLLAVTLTPVLISISSVAKADVANT